jgi:RNA polymerase sigma factor (sigma-70 family)
MKKKSRYQGLNEIQLIELIKGGNTTAFGTLLGRYSYYLLNHLQHIFCSCCTKEDIEDIFQEACVKIYDAVKTNQYIPEKTLFCTWISSIARNHGVDYTRSKKTPLQHGELVPIENCVFVDRITPEVLYCYKQYLQKIMDAAERNGHLMLRLIEGYSYAQIAEEVGININTVRTRLRYARASLKLVL